MSMLEFAVKRIKEECERHDMCEHCPLYDDRWLECGITSRTPTAWKVVDTEDVVEKIFR